MATQRVAFEITTDEAGAIQGIRKVGDEFDKLGGRGGRAFTLLKKQQQEAHEASRLLTRAFGVEVPSGLEKIIAKSKTIAPLLSAAFNVSIVAAFGAAVLSTLPTVAKYIDHLRGITAELDAQHDAAVRVNQVLAGEKTSRQVIAAIQGKKKELEDLRKVLVPPGGVNYGPTPEEHYPLGGGWDDRIRHSLDRIPKIKKELEELDGQLAESQVRERQAQLEILKQGSDVAQIGLKGMAAIAAQARATHEEIAKAEGLNLMSAEKARDLNALADKRAAAEKAQLLRDAARQTEAAQRQAAMVGLEGVDLVLAKERAANAETMQLYNDTLITWQDVQRRKAAAHAAATNEISALERAYHRDTQKVVAQAVAATLEGYAKIEADRRAKLQEAADEFKRQFGGSVDPSKNADYLARVAAINNAADEERLKAHREFLNETVAIENEAAILSLPPWERANAEIIADLNERLKKQRELLDKDAISGDEYRKRKTALEHLANAKMQEDHRQMVEQMASDYQSAFDDVFGGRIGQRILANAKKFAFLLLAQLTLGGRGEGQQGGGLLGTLGGIIGGLIFGPRSQAGGAIGGGGNARPGVNSFLPGGSAFYGGSGGVQVGAGGVNVPDLEAASGGGSASRSGALGLLGANRGQLLSGLGIAGAGLVGGKFGGTLGALGATAGALGIINILRLSKATGLSLGALQTPMAGLLYGGTAGALIGWGVGSKYGKTAGALSGAASGALVGLMVGGPVGALIGGLVGLFSGIFGGLFGGSKRKKQANQFVDQQLLPQLKQIQEAYESFQMDYGSAIANLDALAKQSDETLRQLRGEGKSVLKNRALPEIDRVRAIIQGDEQARLIRMAREYAPPQYHDGGTVRRRGGLRGDEQVAVLQEGEEVIKRGPASKNRGLLKAINDGYEVAAGEVHLHIYPQRLDRQWLRNGGALEIAAALRQAVAEGLL